MIAVELHDTDPRGARLGGSRVVMTQCRVIRQSGDGLRLGNLAAALQRFYHCMTVALFQKDPENPDVDVIDKGTMPVVQKNLSRFLQPEVGGRLPKHRSDTPKMRDRPDMGLLS